MHASKTERLHRLADTAPRSTHREKLYAPDYPGRPNRTASSIVVTDENGLQEVLDNATGDWPPSEMTIFLDGPYFRGAQARFYGDSPIYQWEPNPYRAIRIVGVTQPDGSKPMVAGIVNKVRHGDVELWLENITLSCPQGGVDALGAPVDPTGRWATCRLFEADFGRDPHQKGIGPNNAAAKWWNRSHGGAAWHYHQVRHLAPAQEHNRYTDDSAFLIDHGVEWGEAGRTAWQELSRQESAPRPPAYLGIYSHSCVVRNIWGGDGGCVQVWGYPGQVQLSRYRFEWTLDFEPEEKRKANALISLIVPGSEHYGGPYRDRDGWAIGDVQIANIDFGNHYYRDALMMLDGYRSLSFGGEFRDGLRGPGIIQCRARGTADYRHGPTRWDALDPIGQGLQVHDYNGPNFGDKTHAVLTQADLDAMTAPGYVTGPKEVMP